MADDGRSRAREAAEAFVSTYRDPRTRAAYGSAVSLWIRWCEARRVDPLKVKSWNFDLFRAELEQRLKPATVRIRQMPVARFYDYLVERGELRQSPIPEGWVIAFHYKGVDQTTLLDGDALELFVRAADQVGGMSFVVTHLIVDVGMRSGELTSAHVEDVSFDENGATIEIRPTRGSVSRHRRVPGAVATVLQVLVDDRTEGPLLLNEVGNGLTQRNMQLLLDKVGKAAGIEWNVTPSVLRASAMRIYVERGEAPNNVALLFDGEVRAERLRPFLAEVVRNADSAEPRTAPGEFALELVALSNLLLGESGVEPAAGVVLSAAALEFLLKKICDAQELRAASMKGIEKQAAALRSAGLITKQDKKLLDVWGGLRNSAVHGEFDSVSQLAAQHFNEGLADFIGRYGRLAPGR